MSTLVLAGSLVLVTGGSFVQEAEAEKQPQMRAALTLLENADAQLTDASSDKRGFRHAAREHLAKAITEVKKGIAFDNKH